MKTLTANLPRPMLNRLAAALVLGVGAALLASGAKAQSLQELYDAARAYDATYLAARASAESAEYRAAQADALARPTLGLGAGVTGQRVDPATGTTITTTVTQAGLTGSYSVYNRANAITIEQAQRGLGQARAGLDLAEQDLIVRVAQAYFDVLAAEDSLGTARTSKAAIAEQLASAKRNFEVGTSTVTDSREAQARYDLVVAQEIAAENDLRVKKLAL
ncbi:MAG TPA: TolC family protein, partial [Burkholderiaceae bacterium]